MPLRFPKSMLTDQKYGVFLSIFATMLVALTALMAIVNPWSLLLVGGIPLLIIPLFFLARSLSGEKLPTLLFLVIAVFLLEAVFRVRAYDEKVVDFQILIKVASWLTLITLAFTNLGQVIKAVTSTACLPWTVFFLYLLITSLWAPNHLHSAVAAISVISFYFLFASLRDRVDPDDVLLAILAGITLLALASIVIYFVNPNFGRMHVWAGAQQVLSSRLSGLAGHPNTIGRLCCFGILLCVSQWQNLRRLWWLAPWLVISLLGITLILSNSRTSISIVAILLVVYTLFRVRYLPYLLLLVATCMLTLLLLEPYAEQVMQLLSRSGKAEEIATGTSRTHIWAVVEMLIAQKPIFGWGYGSSVFIMPQYERFMGHAAPHAHNIFLQLWLTTGLTGLLLFLTALASRFLIAIWYHERFVVILLLFVVLNGLSESSAFGGVANITTIALCFAATALKRPPEKAMVERAPPYQQVSPA